MMLSCDAYTCMDHVNYLTIMCHLITSNDNDFNSICENIPSMTPNMTPFVQPLDAGIICCFKAHHCSLFCQCALELNTIGEEDVFKINICEAILCIPLRCSHGHRASHTSLEAWNILEDLATSQKTLPEAKEDLKKVYSNAYEDSVW